MSTDCTTFFPSEVWPENINSSRVFIDIVNACNLRCPECIRGTRTMPNSNAEMPFELFQKICYKLKAEKYKTVELYNWTEPFLHKTIHIFIAEAKRIGFEVVLSSNLSLKKIPLLIDAFDAGLDRLDVSVSGFTNEMQQIYHRGSDIEIVKGHLKNIAQHPKYAKKTSLKLLNFGYNTQSLIVFAEFVSKYGMGSTAIAAAGNPLSATGKKRFFVSIPPKIAVNFESAPEYIYYDIDAILQNRSHLCEIGIIPTIDHTGKVYLCCDRPNSRIFCLGNYLEVSVEEMLLKLYVHPECANCTYEKTLPLSEQQKEKMQNVLFQGQAFQSASSASTVEIDDICCPG